MHTAERCLRWLKRAAAWGHAMIDCWLAAFVGPRATRDCTSYQPPRTNKDKSKGANEAMLMSCVGELKMSVVLDARGE